MHMKDHEWLGVFNMFIGSVLLGGADRDIILASSVAHLLGGMCLVKLEPITGRIVCLYYFSYLTIMVVTIVSMSIPSDKSSYTCAYICMWLGSLIHSCWICIHRKFLM